jgi:glucose/arabinose dehydrogenase/plastocyanin
MMTKNKHARWFAIFLVVAFGTLLLSACDAAMEPTATLQPSPTPADPVGVGVTTPEMVDTPTPEVMDTPTRETAETPLPVTPTPAVVDTPTPAMERVDIVGLELVAEGLSAPTVLTEAPDNSGRLFVADQIGVIRIIDANGQLLPEPFLDLADRVVSLRTDFDERGLLGLAFHPDYGQNGRFYVYYSAPLRQGAPADWDHTSHISQFTVSANDPNVADPNSERIVMQVDQPQFNHNAGAIIFGPDRYLYISLGDGGRRDDTGPGHVEDWYDVNEGGNAQNRQANLLGSILRIDVNVEETAESPYAIPADNPFVGEGGMEETSEIWAYGLRNPWGISFDMGGTQELFAADAGQDLWEEVNIITAGGNYGWNVKEATSCFNTDDPRSPRPACPDETPYGNPLIDPVIEYPHFSQPGVGVGLVVVGGHVYRGNEMPQFEGQYIFGDWSTSFNQPDGKLLAATRPETEGQMWSMRELEIADRPDGSLGHFVLALGQDADGEIYVLTSDMSAPTGQTGRVYRLVAAAGVVAPAATPVVTPTRTPTATGTPVATPLTPAATPITPVATPDTPTPEPGVSPTPQPGLTPTPPGTPTPTVTPVGTPAVTPTPGALVVEVVMQNFLFVPAQIEVQTGTTVRWINQDNVPHTATAGTRNNPTTLFDSGNMAAGATFTFTFNEAGTYNYFCALHPGMDGVVIVED